MVLDGHSDNSMTGMALISPFNMLYSDSYQMLKSILRPSNETYQRRVPICPGPNAHYPGTSTEVILSSDESQLGT